MRRTGIALAALVVALAAPAAAVAKDPGRWRLAAKHTIPIQWFQGMTHGGGALFFDGIENGLYRATPTLKQQRGVTDGRLIPPAVALAQKYNHIGDLSYDKREGGRVLLPLECYDPNASPSNCAGTGAIGVADPKTLAWRYDVTLADIPKAMWCEVSPDGSLLWTSADDDLLAYRTADITRAHAFPATPIQPVRRLRGAVPPSGITGAAFFAGRLFLAGSQDSTYQVWSVGAKTGTRRLEIERTIHGESEGLDTVDALGGVLHWMIQPIDAHPTYAKSTILSFFPHVTPHAAFRPGRLTAGQRTTLHVRVTAKVLGKAKPLAGATVRLLGK
ncbi:MAG TPA: hypothetical protein VGI54_11840, partial [Solirubrobacteraceae bacterium]